MQLSKLWPVAIMSACSLDLHMLLFHATSVCFLWLWHFYPPLGQFHFAFYNSGGKVFQWVGGDGDLFTCTSLHGWSSFINKRTKKDFKSMDRETV